MLSPQTITSALKIGHKMLIAEDISTPNAWNKDLANLQELLEALLMGKITLNLSEEVPNGPKAADVELPAGDGEGKPEETPKPEDAH